MRMYAAQMTAKMLLESSKLLKSAADQKRLLQASRDWLSEERIRIGELLKKKHPSTHERSSGAACARQIDLHEVSLASFKGEAALCVKLK